MKIKELKIYTSNIEKQLEFYRDELGFEITNYSEDGFNIVAGYSSLRFEKREKATPYHIALHVPDNQEKEALKWLESIVPVLKYNDDKIIDFSNWQAKSVYFYDQDKNIMELISRRKFHKPESAIFNSSNIVGIAEIGLVTKDIKEKFEKLKLECGLDHFDGDFERFCAIGDPSGLLITIDNDKKDWFPTSDKAYSSDFELEFEHDSKTFKLNFSNDELEISEI
ncbi:catechol-2,3-dioxygenase [Christiangramia gaetbulicola]|uniref:Catechol-2,3-dioxygenase n=1 Tax=Christiangramia gaetbulicola TaxID=703340 RepID=A0A2T6AIY0_9FLAO|nr:glyoxalase [Christiangramia gaetbulicola]PTX43762.1 catechol-2,3-dioxygenase [Christiangramia gaetbulicola]